MKVIQLSKGLKTLVDDEDFERFGHSKWHAKQNRKGGSFYASRSQVVDGKRVRLMLHREILGDCGDRIVDHISGDTLDNRKTNLRLTYAFQNSQNQSLRRDDKTSNFKGVSMFRNKWCAQICVRQIRVHLGNFDTEQDAAKAYDIAAACLFGEHARPNLPLPTNLSEALRVSRS